jgi:hypothetical protein
MSMEYRRLGESGILVSNLALGTMNFGTKGTPEAEAFAQLDAFLDAGGNLIDTADVYNDGVAGETIGRWLAGRPREVTNRAVIATKGRTRTGDDVNDAGTSRRHLDRALTTSLRRLGTGERNEQRSPGHASGAGPPPVPVHLLQPRNLRPDLGRGGHRTPGRREGRHLTRPGGPELGSRPAGCRGRHHRRPEYTTARSTAPDALGALIQAHTKGDHDGIHPAR